MDPVASRRELYDIFADPEPSVEEQIQRAFELGKEYLELPIGFFTRIRGGTQEFVLTTGDHPSIRPGETCPLENAYCRRTVEVEGPLAVHDAPASTEIADSAVETFDLGTYIGAKVIVGGETYGTVCFADEHVRDVEFSESERFFVELLAGLVRQSLEREVYESELADRETEIKKKDEVYRAVVDSSFDLVFQIDADGRYSYVSPTVEDLLGYSPDEYIGQPFTSMLPDEETIATAEQVFESVMAGETVERTSFPLEHESGERIPVDIRVAPLFSGDVAPEERSSADIVAVQGMARDVRERQRNERIIRVLNRVLRHNLRNDMNVIGGFAEVLEERLNGEEATMARRIVRASDRLVNLSETARKLEENVDAPVERTAEDIVPTVTSVVDRTAEQYPAASISLDTPDSAIAHTAPRLETAIWELLDNAARHAGPEPSILVTAREDDDQVVIRIEDDGPGLPAQERAVLVSGEETPLVHGSGLGLWLVHQIIASLDGDLQVRDANENTAIEISLARAVDT